MHFTGVLVLRVSTWDHCGTMPEKEFPNGTVKIRWDDPDGWPDVSVCDLEDVRTLRLSYKPGRETAHESMNSYEIVCS